MSTFPGTTLYFLPSLRSRVMMSLSVPYCHFNSISKMLHICLFPPTKHFSNPLMPHPDYSNSHLHLLLIPRTSSTISKSCSFSDHRDQDSCSAASPHQHQCPAPNLEVYSQLSLLSISALLHINTLTYTLRFHLLHLRCTW